MSGGAASAAGGRPQFLPTSFSYGGDYNPEQWPREVWDDDVTLMNRAGVNLASVGIFSWARLEPRDGEFDFAWLDDVLDTLHAGGVRVDLATATASPPPWLAKAHPESLPVTADGVTLSPGSRQAYCPSSPVYRRYAARLVTEIVARYRDHPALELWHVNNEYGCHVSHCWCDESAAAFRVWLRARYGTIEALNDAWGTAFWSQRYDSFDEILPPRAAPSFKNPTQLIDFDRFSSDELMALYAAEVDIIRAGSDKPITTNFMGFFKAADYWRWAPLVDVVSDDSYPDPADPHAPAFGAMQRDLMRSLGGGRPWLLMEQSPGAVNWRERNAAKTPGQMAAWSYQCVGRGADGVLFFQWRQAKAGAEKFHAGMVPHAGPDSRVFEEVAALGAGLAALTGPAEAPGSAPGLLGAPVPASVAIVFDWDSWWALEQEASPTSLSYVAGVFAWYRALSAAGVTVDFVSAAELAESGAGAGSGAGSGSLDRYRVIVAPTFFVATDAALRGLGAYVEGGGTLIASFQTGILDENLHVRLGGYLGPLRETLGLIVEEFAPSAAPDLAAVGGVAPPPVGVRGELFADEAGSDGSATATLWREYLRVSTAAPWAFFDGGALDGLPALTRNSRGAGTAWYLATALDDGPLARVVEVVLAEAGVQPVVPAGTVPAGVEVVRRGDYLFAINHGDAAVTVDLAGTDVLTGAAGAGLTLAPQGVAILA